VLAAISAEKTATSQLNKGSRSSMQRSFRRSSAGDDRDVSRGSRIL